MPLDWLTAFVGGVAGTMSRSYSLAAYIEQGLQVQLTVDSSPLGLGGYLVEDGKVEEYFISGITSTDEEILSHQRGGSEGQQTWEAGLLGGASPLGAAVEG